MLSRPANKETKRSRPKARPPCGGAPYSKARSKKPNFSLSLNGPADPVLTAGEPINVTAEAIGEFVTAVGDNNKIHQNDRPIIPGLMLMEYLLDRRPDDAKALSMRFKYPAVAGKIMIDGSKNKIIQNGRRTTTYRWIEES